MASHDQDSTNAGVMLWMIRWEEAALADRRVDRIGLGRPPGLSGVSNPTVVGRRSERFSFDGLVEGQR